MLWIDSTVATKKWMSISVPSHLDHANAKELGFLSWADKIAYVEWMKFDMRWVPGSANDFGDLLSRMAEKIHEAAALYMYGDRLAGMSPLTVSTEGSAKGQYDVTHLTLQQGGWDELEQAYLSNTGVIQSVSVADLYKCVCQGAEGVSSEIAMKVQPWVERIYFSVVPPGSERPMLYVPRSQLRQH